MDSNKKRLKPDWQLKNPLLSILLVIPFLCLIFPALDLASQTVTLFPGNDICSHIYTLNDKVYNGNSQIDDFSYNNHELKLNYRLKPGAEFPSVSVFFSIGNSVRPYDLSRINSVSLVLERATVKNIIFFFQTFTPGISRQGLINGTTWRPNQYTLELIPGKLNYKIGIEQFITESWWVEAVKADIYRLPEEDYKQVINFAMIVNPYSSDYIIDRPEQIIVKEIIFNKSMSAINLGILIGVILFYIGIYILQSVYIFRSKLSKIPERKPVQITPYYMQDLTRIKKFLETHYQNPDISVTQVYQELGISRIRVAKLLYNEHQLTFRQIINKMRIDEAQRLLKDSTLKIVDLSYALGFKNITYFNYLFKEHTGQTPSEFKKKKA